MNKQQQDHKPLTYCPIKQAISPALFFPIVNKLTLWKFKKVL